VIKVMNLVSLLIATSVVKYSHNAGLRAGVAIVAVAVVVGAIVIAKRRSTSIPSASPGGSDQAAGPGATPAADNDGKASAGTAAA
jgi:K(+)-stimulated pyrophosphate-energized sodium pump